MSTFQDEYSVYVGNLDVSVPIADMEDLIYELFEQVTLYIIVSCSWQLDN